MPPDNNASERAIRNIKVKQKISGQFKINKAAANFAKIRSVIDTTIKNGLDVLSDKASGHFAGFRGIDLAFAVNRLRGLKIV